MDVFPNTEHRECFNHLMDNLSKTWSGDVFRHMWIAAKAYTPERYDRHFDIVCRATPEVEQWLQENHKMVWTRSKFSEKIKCDYINNNLSEAWNSWIKSLKDLPVDSLADAYREKLIVLWYKRRIIANMLPKGGLLPTVECQLNARSRGLKHLRVIKGLEVAAQILELHNDVKVVRHFVKFKSCQCSCREWQITGKPCCHALAFITSLRKPVMSHYCDMYFTVFLNEIAYEGEILALCDRNQWPQDGKGFYCLPPTLRKKKEGRQRKYRYPSCLEKGKWKPRRQSKCTKCGQVGHRQNSVNCMYHVSKMRVRSHKTHVKLNRNIPTYVNGDEVPLEPTVKRKRRRVIHVADPEKSQAQGEPTDKRRKVNHVADPKKSQAQGEPIDKRRKVNHVADVEEHQPQDESTTVNEEYMPWKKVQCFQKKLMPRRRNREPTPIIEDEA